MATTAARVEAKLGEVFAAAHAAEDEFNQALQARASALFTKDRGACSALGGSSN